MHISLNWLKEFTNLKTDLNPQELSDLITLKTAEVEGFQDQKTALSNMVVGEIIEIKPHPDADRLRVTQVNVGNETVQIVCGGTNIKEGMKVAITKVGAKVRWHGEGDLIEIKPTKVRGVESLGMIAAGSEIGIADPNEQNAGKDEAIILDLNHIDAKPGTPLSEALNLDDIIFEIDNKSLTHRPDLWGHEGIARELAVLTDSSFQIKEPQVELPENGECLEVDIQANELCPRYSGLIINNVQVKPSPQWLINKLKSVGHSPHNNIVDVTNYVMAELGQPMHAFDQNNIEDRIIVRTAKKGETITTLDEQEHQLDETMLLISDSKKPLAVAGVMGGLHSSINDNTTEIVLESANFSASSVRRTSTKLGLRSDSVQRFEKSLDPNLTVRALLRAAELILELCPEAEIAGPITDAGTYKFEPLTVTINFDKVRTKIGIEISDQEIIDILQKLEFHIDGNTVTIPSFRATKDVDIEDDLIEEVARIYGYDRIPETLPTLPTRLPSQNQSRQTKHQLRKLLSYGCGMDEVRNYSFYGEKELQDCLMSEENHLKLQNYLSSDQTHMRTSMIPNLLKSVAENNKNFKEAGLYEIGRTYKDLGNFMPLEEKHLTGVFYQRDLTQNSFLKAKGALQAIFAHLRLNKIKEVSEIEHSPYAHPKKALTYLSKNGEVIARLFEVHPLVLRNHELEKSSVAFFDLNLDLALALETPEQKYQAIPKFPAIQFDISVLVDQKTTIKELQKAIKKDSPLITEVNLFDIYTGKGIAEDKKSVAFSITLQSEKETLTEKDLNQAQQTAFKNLTEIGGEIRGAQIAKST